MGMEVLREVMADMVALQVMEVTVAMVIQMPRVRLMPKSRFVFINILSLCGLLSGIQAFFGQT